MAIARNDTSILARWWWTVDHLTLFAIFILIIFGVLLSLSASPSVAERIGIDSLHFFRKQAAFAIPAMLIIIATSLLDIRSIRRLAVIMLGFSIIFLIMTLTIGAEIKGATRWVSIAGLTIQPSEFAKPAFAIVAAWMFSARRLGEDIPGYAISAGLYVIILTLFLMQPDVGQAIILTVIWASQFFLAGLPMILVFTLVFLAIFGFAMAYNFFPHVKARVDLFLDPMAGNSYQTERSMEAFMNGGIFGRGPGEGSIKDHIPDGHADFILAVAGEEFGLIFCLLIVAIYAFVILRGFIRVLNNNNLFVILAVTGLLVQFGLQALINMASTLNLIPTKGMTLPFISYGGSSLIAVALTIGMVLALTRTRAGGEI